MVHKSQNIRSTTTCQHCDFCFHFNFSIINERAATQSYITMHNAHASIDGGGRTDQTEHDAFACDNGDI